MKRKNNGEKGVMTQSISPSLNIKRYLLTPHGSAPSGKIGHEKADLPNTMVAQRRISRRRGRSRGRSFDAYVRHLLTPGVSGPSDISASRSASLEGMPL